MKTMKGVLTVALAAAFLIAGSAGATIAEWEMEQGVGNMVHFTYDEDDGWDVQSAAGMGQDSTWGQLPESARTHNRDANDPVYWQPLIGEYIYAPDGNVFDLNPWHIGDGLGDFRPDNGNYRWAGLQELRIRMAPGDGFGGFQDFLSDYGSWPSHVDIDWKIDLSNRPVNNPDEEEGPDSTANEVSGWTFNLSQSFDQLADWDTEPLTAWFQDDVHANTWSGFHLLRDEDGDLTRRGYALFATDNEDLMPWLGGTANFASNPYTNWDAFTDVGTGSDYYHVGVTGVGGSTNVTVVPEPASMTLLAFCLAGFTTRRFMSRKKT